MQLYLCFVGLIAGSALCGVSVGKSTGSESRHEKLSRRTKWLLEQHKSQLLNHEGSKHKEAISIESKLDQHSNEKDKPMVLHALQRKQTLDMSASREKAGQTPGQRRVFIQAPHGRAISLTLTFDDIFCSMAGDIMILDLNTYEEVNPCNSGGRLCNILSSGAGLFIASDSAQGNFVIQYENTESPNSDALQSFCSSGGSGGNGGDTFTTHGGAFTTPSPNSWGVECLNCDDDDLWQQPNQTFSFLNYSNNMDESWTFYTPNEWKQIKITVLLDIEDGSNSVRKCSYDWLQVIPRWGAVPIIKMCGQQQCVFYTNSYEVELQFHSDASVIKTGFELRFDLVDVDTTFSGENNTCSGSTGNTTYPTGAPPTPTPPRPATTEPSTTPGTNDDDSCKPQQTVGLYNGIDTGTLLFPGTGGNYGNNCVYHRDFTTTYGNLAFRIRWLNIENGGPNCMYDKLTIKVNIGTDDEREEVLCGNIRNYVIHSRGGASLEFRSDGSLNKKGFELQVAPWSDNDLLDPPFTIESEDIDACAEPTSSRIVGGEEAEENSHPWIVSLGTMGSHFCGGSIVDKNTIVTAAHCIYGNTPAGITVTAGEHSLAGYSGDEQTVFVRTIIAHPDYDPGTMDSDIAVLKLKQDLAFTPHVTPVCVADDQPLKDTICTAAGWGTLAAGGSSPDELYEVDLPVVIAEDCTKWTTRYDILDTMFCAGLKEGGVDTCQGDSGGPLTCDVDGVTKLVGATSWGIGCGLENHPGVYTKVAKFYDWIRANMEYDRKEQLLLRVIAELSDLKKSLN